VPSPIFKDDFAVLERPIYAELIRRRIEANPVVSLLGPRQVGKTTLARKITQEFPSPHFFDLENPVAANRLREPLTALDPLEGLVVIDEVQRQPELMPRLDDLLAAPPSR
jgi:uncharacterized protein